MPNHVLRLFHFCLEHDITYQGFSLLTANREVLSRAEFRKIVENHAPHTEAQVIFRFAQQVGMLPLTGTGSAEHMREDLECVDFSLEQKELELVEGILLGFA